MCCSLSLVKLCIVSQDHGDARRRGRAGRVECGRCRSSDRGRAQRRADTLANSDVDAPRTDVERNQAGESSSPGRRRSPRGATRARRSCSAGTRCAGGTCPAAARRTLRGSGSRSRSVRSHSSNWPSSRRSCDDAIDHRPDLRLVGLLQRANGRLDRVGEHQDGRLARLWLWPGVAEPALVDRRLDLVARADVSGRRPESATACSLARA